MDASVLRIRLGNLREFSGVKMEWEEEVRSLGVCGMREDVHGDEGAV